MAEIDIDVINHAQQGEFSDFSSKVKDVLDQKVKSHPYIQAKKAEYMNHSRIKDTFAQVSDFSEPEPETYLDGSDSPTNEE